MAAVRRTHFFLPRKVGDEGLVKVVLDSDYYHSSDHMLDVLVRAVCRLYEQEKGDGYYGLTGEVA